MAKIVYALSGQGRGHSSRAIAIADALRNGGHDVLFCCGGMARRMLADQGEPVIPVPVLRQVVRDNEVQLGQTVRANWWTVLNGPRIARRLADTLETYQPDLLVSDFEAFSPYAAKRIGVPVLSLNHQQIVTETDYPIPPRYWFQASMTRLAISALTPSRPARMLLTSFFFPPLQENSRATLVPPILRPAVQAITPHQGEHVLVYFNHAQGAEHVLETLGQSKASFIVYNFDAPDNEACYPNLTFKRPSRDGFLADLAASRAVICTAGFTLISEALHLGKPVLAVPNRGLFEQTINALALRREGLGQAVFDRHLTSSDVDAFLGQLPRFLPRIEQHRTCGNNQALSCIEHLLPNAQPSASLTEPFKANSPQFKAPSTKNSLY